MIKIWSQTWTFRNCQISGKKASLWDLTLQKLKNVHVNLTNILFESKGSTNSSPEVQQFTNYISDFITNIKTQGIQYTHRLGDIL